MLKRLKSMKPTITICVAFLLIALPILAQSTGEDKLPNMDSDNPRAQKLFEEGKALLDKDQFEMAVAKFEQATNVDYNFVRAHFRYMDAMTSLGRVDEMKAKYKVRAESAGKKAIDLYLYGRTFENPSDKRWYYRKAVELDQKYYWAQYGIGGTYLVEGNTEEAIISFNKTLDLNPNWVEPLKVLGTLYLNKGMLFQAREKFERVIELDPEANSVYLSLGRVYSQLNLPESAEKSLLKAAVLDSKDPRPYYLLGVLYELNNRPEDAKQAYRQFLAIDPKNEIAQAVKENLKKLEDKK